MAILCERLEPHISLDRVEGIDLIREIVECSLCHGLIWKSTFCDSCEKPFCSACIQALHAATSKPLCPHAGCSTYTERPTPKYITNLLIHLKISCCYKSNGCTEILSYNELEEHENNCDYQLLLCDGCKQGIIKNNLMAHNSTCGLVLIRCNQCSSLYKREDENLHTLTECLRLQLQEQKTKAEQLEKKVADQQIRIDQMEQKLKENDNFWTTFSVTINELRKLNDDD